MSLTTNDRGHDQQNGSPWLELTDHRWGPICPATFDGGPFNRDAENENKPSQCIYVRKVTENIRRKKKYWYWRELNCSHWLVFTRPVQIWTPATCTQQARPKICFLCFDLNHLEGPQIGYGLYLIGISSPNMFGWYSCVWTLKGWIYVLVYIMYLKRAGIMLQFCLTGIVRTAGGLKGWNQWKLNPAE